LPPTVRLTFLPFFDGADFYNSVRRPCHVGPGSGHGCSCPSVCCSWRRCSGPWTGSVVRSPVLTRLKGPMGLTTSHSCEQLPGQQAPGSGKVRVTILFEQTPYIPLGACSCGEKENTPEHALGVPNSWGLVSWVLKCFLLFGYGMLPRIVSQWCSIVLIIKECDGSWGFSVSPFDWLRVPCLRGMGRQPAGLQFSQGHVHHLIWKGSMSPAP